MHKRAKCKYIRRRWNAAQSIFSRLFLHGPFLLFALEIIEPSVPTHLFDDLRPSILIRNDNVQERAPSGKKNKQSAIDNRLKPSARRDTLPKKVRNTKVSRPWFITTIKSKVNDDTRKMMASFNLRFHFALVPPPKIGHPASSAAARRRS